MPRYCLAPLLLTLLAPLLMGQDAPPAASAVTPTMAAAVQTLPEAAYGLILIPDLNRLSQHGAQLAALFQDAGPAQPTLRDWLAGLLGDPGLTNLAHTPIVGVVVPGVPAPGIALIIPCVKPQAYLDALANVNMTGQAIGTLAVVSNNPGALHAGVAIAASFQALIATPDAADIRVVLSPKRLAAAYGGFLSAMIPMIAVRSAPNVAQVLGTELSAVLTISADVEAVQSDLTWTGTTLTIDDSLVARTDSALAKALVAPPRDVVPSPAALLDNRDAFLAVAGRLNANASGAYIGSLGSTLANQPGFAGLITPALIADLSKAMTAQTGTLALQMFQSKGAPINLVEAIGSTDPKSLEAIQKEIMGLFGAGFAMKMLGATTVFDAGVRSVGKIPIDRFTTTYAPGRQPPGMGPQQPIELACTDSFLLLSQDPAGLDAMILGTNHGMSLQAQKDFPAGMDFYGDLAPDVLANLVTVANPSFVPPAHLSHAAVTMAWAFADGTARFHVHVPLGSLTDIASIVASLKAQHGQPPEVPARAQPASAGPTF